jgi:hypothetical protein
VVVEVAGSLVTAGLAAMRRLLADLSKVRATSSSRLKGDDGLLDPMLLAALSEARGSCPRCQLTVAAADRPVRSFLS